MQRDVVVIGAKIVVSAAAGALTLQRLVAAHDTVAVLYLVPPKTRADGAAFGDGHAALLTFAAQPAGRVDGGSAVSDFEVQVRRKIRVRDPDSPDLRTLLDVFMKSHVGSR